jgi:hypothetical protein
MKNFFAEKGRIAQALTCGSYYRCVTLLMWRILKGFAMWMLLAQGMNTDWSI